MGDSCVGAFCVVRWRFSRGANKVVEQVFYGMPLSPGPLYAVV